MSITTPCLFPRLEKLRSTHCEHSSYPQMLTGKLLSHISKKRSLKFGIFYKVTICRDCSDSNEYVELGCFADLESAILANDVYEMLSHRTLHVHLLTDEDMKFANELTVSRSWRNQMVEVNLMQLMKENISRSEISPFTVSTDTTGGTSTKPTASTLRSASEKQKRHGPSSAYRRVMTNRFLQLIDANSNFIKALCCVPQAACDINPVLIAMTKLSIELHSSQHNTSAITASASISSSTSMSLSTSLLISTSASTSTFASASTSKLYHARKNLEAILTSATACGLISTSLIKLLSASCLEGDNEGTNGSGMTGYICNSLGVESILSFSDIVSMKKNMVEAISCKQHIGVWGDIMRQLLWINHTAALKCEMDLHMPLWEPVTSPSTKESNLLSIWDKSVLHYNIVQELMSSLHTGADTITSDEILSSSSSSSSTATRATAPVNDINHMNSLLDVGRCTVVLTLSGLGTAVLLNHHFGLLSATHLNSVFEHFVKWERLVRTTNISNETVVVPFALYECIKLEVFSTYVDGELKTSKTSRDIRPQLLLAAQVATITLRMLNKETGNKASSNVSSAAHSVKRHKSVRHKKHGQHNYYKELNQNDATSRHMFGIKNELALRINISLMCLAVATGDLSCMGTVNVTEAVIIAVHTLLNKLRKWLDMTEGGCGILFAQTQLSLFKCIRMEEELATQLRESNPEHSDRLSLEFEMVREISSLAEQVLRSLSTRFMLSKMLLAQLSSRCEADTDPSIDTVAPVHLSSLNPPSSLPSVRQSRLSTKRKRVNSETDGAADKDVDEEEEEENDRDDITDIISLYSQSCRSISSYTTERKVSSTCASGRLSTISSVSTTTTSLVTHTTDTVSRNQITDSIVDTTTTSTTTDVATDSTTNKPKTYATIGVSTNSDSTTLDTDKDDENSHDKKRMRVEEQP